MIVLSGSDQGTYRSAQNMDRPRSKTIRRETNKQPILMVPA